MMEESTLQCKKEIGCHECPISYLEEDLRLFRAAIVQFLIEPSKNIDRLKEEALSLKTQINLWIGQNHDQS